MNTQVEYALFETTLGWCGLAWDDAWIRGVHFPEASLAQTQARLASRFPLASESAPSALAHNAIRLLTDALAGKDADLSAIPLHMADLPNFHRRVYEATRAIPRGMTLSYGDVAAKVGSPRAFRAVGQALKRNPFAIVVPCHRVLGAKGAIGGFTAEGGVRTKMRLLELEGAYIAHSV